MDVLVQQLQRPEAYPSPTHEIELVETHISWVFLAGDYVYKVKKPVDLGFVDYSTLHRRLACCQAEVELNQRLAPNVYVGVVPITRWGDRLEFEGMGETVEYAVKMHRLRHERMLDELIAADELEAGDVERLARLLARFHASAATGPGVDQFGARKVIAQNWHESLDQVRPFTGKWLSHAQFLAVHSYARAQLKRLSLLFAQRVLAGCIRDCHGDLRSESVWMGEDGRFEVFDCIEFNDRLRFGDVASEVAFLASDLDWRGRPDLAWAWVHGYVAASGDVGLYHVLPFYKCYRAFVRGKVEALEHGRVAAVPERARHGTAARQHFELAELYTVALPPTMVLICGAARSGKTALARGISSLLGLELTSSIHTAGAALAAGRSVVLDGDLELTAQRQSAIDTAEALACGFVVVQTAGRGADVPRERFEAPKTCFEAPDGLKPAQLLVVDTSGPTGPTARGAVHGLRQRLHGASGGLTPHLLPRHYGFTHSAAG